MNTVKIIADSINPAGIRVTSMLLTYNRFIHSELMTHRVFSRNASSSRAIPLKKMIDSIVRQPAMPITWPKNQSSMQAVENLSFEYSKSSENIWREAMHEIIYRASELERLGLHKQVVNRILEPWAHMTTLVTATEWTNFFALRVHKDAQPDFQDLAVKMLEEYLESEPNYVQTGGWHIPFGDQYMPGSVDQMIQVKIATGRCARTSYKNQEGNYSVEDDLKLHDRLIKQVPLHASALEHCCQAREDNKFVDSKTGGSNFRGWTQYRKFFKNENVQGIDLRTLLEEYRNGSNS